MGKIDSIIIRIKWKIDRFFDDYSPRYDSGTGFFPRKAELKLSQLLSKINGVEVITLGDVHNVFFGE
jgi:hypothetical protein